jgi:replicative DNA helicase
MDPTRSVSLEKFVQTLYPSQSEGLLELRGVPSRARVFVEPHDFPGIRQFISRHQHENVFYGVATRRTAGDGSLSNCLDVWTLWVDIDFKTIQEEAARNLLGALHIPSNITVRSGHGLHVYWLLRHPLNAQRDEVRLREVLQRLTRSVRGDLAAADPARVLRLPYTLNHKYAPPRLATIESYDSRHSYQLEELEDTLPLLPPASRSPSRATVPARISEGARNTTLYLTGRALKLRGLGGDAILAALLEENRAKCDPPLPDDEVRRLAEHVATQPDRPGFSPFSSAPPVNSGNSENSGKDSPLVWESPTPFHETALPAFPTDTLPDWLRDYVEATAIETQTPPDLAALVTLSVVSATCAGVVAVEVRDHWVEPLNIFTVVAMDPGNRKSPVFNAALAPFVFAEKLTNYERAPQIIAATTRHEAARQRLKEAETALKKAPHEDQARRQEEVERCARELVDIKIPPACRRLADDITPEKVASLLAEQDGRLAIMSAEGDLFDMLAGRYSAGGISNFGVLLKGHSGDPVRVDRIGRASEYVERPALTVCLTVQPEVIRGLHRHPEFRGRGLLARFFYALPESLMGRREIRPPVASTLVRSTYAHAIEKLAAIPVERDEAENVQLHELTLSNAARGVLSGFERWLEPQLAPFGELAHMTDWAGKLAGGVVRVAGLLHMATHWRVSSPAPWDLPIDETTVSNAIQIGRYLIAHAQAAYTLMGADPEVERAKIVLAWVTAGQKTHFTVRELYQGTRGRFKRVAELAPALSILVDHGFIREATPTVRPGPGRKPSARYDVNPLVYPQNPHNPQNAPRPREPGGRPRPRSAERQTLPTRAD